MAGDTGAAAREWREGWPIVFACTCGMSLLGMGFLTASTYFAPLEAAFHWTRAQTTSAFTVYALPSILFAPAVGVLLDKLGFRRIALVGCVLVGGAWALFATLNGSVLYWLLLWLLLAGLSQLIMVTLWSKAISSYFTASRGLALGVTMAGNGVMQFVAPNIANHLIDSQGWRAAFLITGLGWGAIVTLVCYFLLKEPLDKEQGQASEAAPSAELTGYSVRDGVRSASFIKIISAVFICYLVTIGLMIHLIPVLTWGGLTQDQAVWIYSSVGITGILGNVLGGHLVDRLPAKPFAAILIALPAVACLMLLQPTGSLVQRVIAANIFGICAGGQMPAFGYLSTRYFGLRNFGTLFGFVTSAMAVPTSIAPVLAGLLFDRSHSYTTVLMLFIPLALLGGLVMLSLGRYPHFDPVARDAAAAEPATA